MLSRHARGGRSKVSARGQGHGLVHLGLLNVMRKVDVHRRARRGHGDQTGTVKGLRRGGNRCGLGVPLGVVAHQSALVLRGVNPLNPRAAGGGVHGAGGTKDHERHTVAPSIEDGSGGVHQAHIAVHKSAHGATGDFGIAMGNGHRMFLMQTQQHLRIAVAQKVHQTVV